MTNDPRLKAFCAPDSPAVFYPVVNDYDVLNADPYDVASVNRETRETIHQLLNRAAAAESPGRLFLTLGESGAGKTHLMRHLRNHVHSRDAGYFTYMQVTSQTEDYGRLFLSHLISALDCRYNASGETTGLMHLANAMADIPPGMKRIIRQWDRKTGKTCRRASLSTALKEWKHLKKPQVSGLIAVALREILKDARFQHLDMNLLTALLYYRAGTSFTRRLITDWLAHRPLAPALLDGFSALPPVSDLPPIKMIAELGRVMWTLQKRPLIFCVDQLDGLLSFPDRNEHINRFLGTLVDVAAAVPSCVIVISCLENLYDTIQSKLTAAIRSKIEQPPGPKVLKSLIETEDDIRRLAGRRLQVLYKKMGAAYNPDQPLYPFPEADLLGCLKLPARKVLEICAAFHERAIQTGKLPEALWEGTSGERREGALLHRVEQIELEWRQFLATYDHALAADPDDRADLLARTLECGSHETVHPPLSAHADGRFVETRGGEEPLCIGICDRKAQGNGLRLEIEELEKRAGNRRIIMARSSDFPKSGSKISKYIEELIEKGARRVVPDDSEWQALAAFQKFYGTHGQTPGFQDWQKKHRPLTAYASIREILGIENTADFSPVPPKPLPKPKSEPKPKSTQTPALPPAANKAQSGEDNAPDVSELARHPVFIRAPENGKSAAAANLIKQLLHQGIPVLLIGRNANSYTDAAPKSADTAIYTPGSSEERPLSVSIIPNGAYLLSTDESERLTRISAEMLSDMMGLKTGRRDRACREILKHTIEILSETDTFGRNLLQEMIDLIGSPDAELFSRAGQPDTRSFKRLAQSLETLRLNRGHLLENPDNCLNAGELFGMKTDKKEGSARLSIISTRFLGDRLNIDCFITLLLLELAVWVHPNSSAALQGAIIIDNAGDFFPADRDSSAKAAMKMMLKRAESSGIGIAAVIQGKEKGDGDFSLFSPG